MHAAVPHPGRGLRPGSQHGSCAGAVTASSTAADAVDDACVIQAAPGRLRRCARCHTDLPLRRPVCGGGTATRDSDKHRARSNSTLYGVKPDHDTRYKTHTTHDCHSRAPPVFALDMHPHMHPHIDRGPAHTCTYITPHTWISDCSSSHKGNRRSVTRWPAWV